MPFLTQRKTNWKYILIVVILAIAVGGEILYYWWQISQYETKHPEAQVAQKTRSVSQKITLTSDSDEYERKGVVKLTILNNSSNNVYFPERWGKPAIKVTFQKYDSQKESWENAGEAELVVYTYPGKYSPGVYLGKDIVFEGILKPSEKIEGDIYLAYLVEQLVFIPEKYRAIISYYENEDCRGSFFWNNQEFCDTRQKLVFSNEFLIKKAILPEGAIEPAVDFCRTKDKLYYYEKAFFLNFDDDLDKEIIGLCWKYTGDKEGILFVLEKRDNKYESVLERECVTHQREYTCLDLEINDLDKDGIDEIIYKDIGWWMGGRDIYLHLYSPKYNEWFWRNDWERRSRETEEITKGTKFSSNINREEYKIFKEFLEAGEIQIRERLY